MKTNEVDIYESMMRHINILCESSLLIFSYAKKAGKFKEHRSGLPFVLQIGIHVYLTIYSFF